MGNIRRNVGNIFKEIFELLLQGYTNHDAEQIRKIQEHQRKALDSIPFAKACNWQDGKCEQMRIRQTAYNCCANSLTSICQHNMQTGCEAGDRKTLLCEYFLCNEASENLERINPEMHQTYIETKNAIEQTGYRPVMEQQWRMNQRWRRCNEILSLLKNKDKEAI